MTYSYHSTSFKKYEFTAFSEADLLDEGDSNFGCGDIFTMPVSATTCITVCDDDLTLSGDNYCNENANDYTGQTATIETPNGTELGNFGQIYAESYFWVQDQAGNWFLLIEVEQEGSNQSFYTFHNAYGIPDAGTELTVVSQCNVNSNWVDYASLGAGECAPPTGSITGTVWCDLDCDGFQDVTVTTEKGEPIFAYSVTYEGVTCTTYNVDCYGEWYSTGWDVIDLVVGADAGHHGNAYDNTIVELDKGGVWTRKFHVEEGGTYCLNLDVYRNSCVDDGGNGFKILVNGVVVDVTTVLADGSLELSVELEAGLNRIDFVSTSDVSGFGAGIDNVNFTPLITTTTPSEPVKEGVLIKLLNADGTAVLDENGEPVTTRTDADGTYRFDDVPVGDYRIMGVAPDGTEFTIQDVDGNSKDGSDSDVDGAGMSGLVSVTADGVADVDLGLCEKPLGSLAGRYFCDTDGDARDSASGEPAVAGVQVTLYLVSGSTLTIVGQQDTDSNGDYLFTDLEEGTYRVAFTLPSDIPGQTDKGFVAANQGDDINDSDVIDPATGQTADIFLAAGANVTDVDAGIVYINKPPEVDPTPLAAKGCADETISIDFSGAYSDPDSASVGVSMIDGIAITAGGPAVTLANGVEVQLTDDDVFIFDGESAYAYLDINETAQQAFEITIADSDGAEVSTNITVTFCGDANSVQSWTDALPETITFQVQVTDLVRPVEDTAYDIRIDTGDTDSRLDGLYISQAYCLSRNEPIQAAEDINDAPLVTGTIVAFDDPNVADVFPLNGLSAFNGQSATDNLDLVNWILNQDFENNGFTGWEVQRAIWELMDSDDLAFLDNIDSGFGSDANVQQILTAASAQEGYTPGVGDVIGVLIDLDPSDPANQQPFVVALDFETYDCLC